MPEPTLETERLLLEPLTPLREWLVAELYGNPDVVEGWNDFPYAGKRLEAQLTRLFDTWRVRGFCQFVIRDKEMDRLAGIVGVRPTENAQVGELGYLLRPDTWGRGYATEAAENVVAWAFRRLDLDAVIATRVCNPASMRVLEKIGFVETAVEERHGVTFRSFTLAKRPVAQRDDDHRK